MVEIPSLIPTAWSTQGNYTYVMDFLIPDPGRGVLARDETSRLPASSAIAGFSLYRVTLPDTQQEPGRDAQTWGEPILQIPYDDGDTEVWGLNFEDACNDGWTINVWLAIGLDFHGGAGGNVRSALVGRALKLPCPFRIPVLAGGYADGVWVQGEQFRIGKTFGPDGLELSFFSEPACSEQMYSFPGDRIYEGPLGHWYSHVPIGGCLFSDWSPAEGNTYYLPIASAYPQGPELYQASEGHGGRRSDGTPRYWSAAGCIFPGGFCF